MGLVDAQKPQIKPNDEKTRSQIKPPTKKNEIFNKKKLAILRKNSSQIAILKKKKKIKSVPFYEKTRAGGNKKNEKMKQKKCFFEI